jgi:hypothetical protein
VTTSATPQRACRISRAIRACRPIKDKRSMDRAIRYANLAHDEHEE